ncbi:alpha/beta hydrolase [Patescibacteria group bacterium]|nr:MAG: alpha/beta hydrolase [Patescibacteria group bacterium]
MKPKQIIIITIVVVAAVSLLIGLRQFRQLQRGKAKLNQGALSTALQPIQDLGDCTVIGTTKDTRVYKQVPGVDPNLLSLDIYTPKTKGGCNTSHPLMIYVHGGGWQIGDKGGQIKNKATYFPSHGYVFVSVNYRLAPAVTYPVFNQDVAAAVKFVYDNATNYGADTTKITIMGHSAGGGIISSVSTDEKYLAEVGLPLSTFRCAVSLDTEGYNVSAKAAENTKIYQPAFGTDESSWPEASPINHVSAGKSIPSFFIVTRGNEVRISGAKAFQLKLEQAGVLATLIETPTLDHEGVNASVGDPKDTLITPTLQEFLNTTCQ